jgi:5' nucleotidase, deoxy (Pyrimidine), cytosolic type C protein (NT5C)
MSKIIAVDLDDTISLTNLSICQWHNENYGTSLSIDDFHSYYYWKNPGWGTPVEAISKVHRFLESPAARKIPPIPGAQRGTKRLKEAGYRLVVITARMHSIAADTVDWVEEHFPGIFETVYFTSAFQALDHVAPGEELQDSHNLTHKNASSHLTEPRGGRLPAYSIARKKSDVCLHVGAIALIDDAIENAFDVYENSREVECLIYGTWKWNLTLHRSDREEDQLSYEQAKERGLCVESLEPTPLPNGIQRTRTWAEVVTYITRPLEN